MKTLKEQKWMIIVYGIVLFSVGLVDLILSIVDVSSAMRIVSYAISGGLFLVGVLHIIANLVKDTKSFFRGALALGCIAIAVGVVFVVYPYMLGQFLVYFVAALIIALSAVLIAKGIIGIVYKYKKSWIFCYFLLASIGIALSILGFIYGESEPVVKQVIYITIGAIAMTLGVILIVSGIKLLSKKSD